MLLRILDMPMTARSRAWVGGGPLPALPGSNPAWGMDNCLVSVVCCELEVSATDLSLFQRSRTKYVCVCVCVIECGQV